jgi:diacylglycerol kinase family enzyme
VLLKDIMDKHPASPDGRGADRRRLLVVFNPVAGRRHRRRFEATLEALRALGCALELRETEGAGHAGELAAAADPDVFDALVVAGGDGTINEAINGLIPAGARRAALPLAIVPLGTANVLAAEVGLSTRPQSVARTIAGGRVQSIALGRANGRLFTVMGRFYAGRFVVAPDARLEAPEFQVCLFGRGGAWNALRYAAALGLGLLPRLRDYRIVPGREVTIEGPADDPLQGDGDVIARLPVSIKILPDALDLIVPN